jgi:hypothetical protein
MSQEDVLLCEISDVKTRDLPVLVACFLVYNYLNKTVINIFKPI